jgi:hypothetical protein
MKITQIIFSSPKPNMIPSNVHCANETFGEIITSKWRKIVLHVACIHAKNAIIFSRQITKGNSVTHVFSWILIVRLKTLKENVKQELSLHILVSALVQLNC